MNRQALPPSLLGQLNRTPLQAAASANNAQTFVVSSSFIEDFNGEHSVSGLSAAARESSINARANAPRVLSAPTCLYFG